MVKHIFSEMLVFVSYPGDKVTKNYPRKTDMSPENQWLEDVFPIEIVIVPFYGTFVSFRGCIYPYFDQKNCSSEIYVKFQVSTVSNSKWYLNKEKSTPSPFWPCHWIGQTKKHHGSKFIFCKKCEKNIFFFVWWRKTHQSLLQEKSFPKSHTSDRWNI